MENIAYKDLENRSKIFIQKDISLITDSSLFKPNMPLQQPFRTLNPQIVLVMNGTAEFSINLIDYKLKKGNLLLLPINTLFQVLSRSDDFSLKLVDIHLPEIDKLLIFVLQLRKTLLEEADFICINRYFDLLNDCMCCPLENSQSMIHIIMALLFDADTILTQNAPHPTLLKREEELYIKFMKLLLKKYDILPRTVNFYADILKITANHLSSTVKRVSGHSPMYWINKITVSTAQLLLVNENLIMGDIAVKLGFTEQTSFSRFFKKEVGLSPIDYRKQQIEAKAQQG